MNLRFDFIVDQPLIKTLNAKARERLGSGASVSFQITPDGVSMVLRLNSYHHAGLEARHVFTWDELDGFVDQGSKLMGQCLEAMAERMARKAHVMQGDQ